MGWVCCYLKATVVRDGCMGRSRDAWADEIDGGWSVVSAHFHLLLFISADTSL